MSRIIKLDATAPIKIEPTEGSAGKAIFVCACGLSKKFPLCDGSHKVTRDEEAGCCYGYQADGVTREKIEA